MENFKNYKYGTIVMKQKMIDDIDYVLGVSHNRVDDVTIYNISSIENGTTLIYSEPFQVLEEALEAYSKMCNEAVSV